MFQLKTTFVDKVFNNKLEAITFLTESAVSCGLVTDAQMYINSVLKREKEFSTAVGYEVAIPHGSCDAVKESFVAVCKLKEKILWDNEEKINTIFMIGVPVSGRCKEHLQILAHISKNLMRKEFRQKITDTKYETELFALLTELEN